MRAEAGRRGCGAVKAAAQGSQLGRQKRLDERLLGASGAADLAGHRGVEPACLRREFKKLFGAPGQTGPAIFAFSGPRPQRLGGFTQKSGAVEETIPNRRPKRNPLMATSPPPEGSLPMLPSEPAPSSPRPWAPRQTRLQRGGLNIPRPSLTTTQNRNFLLCPKPEVSTLP